MVLLLVATSCSHGLELPAGLFSRRAAVSFVGAQLTTLTALASFTAIDDSRRITSATASMTSPRYRRVPKLIGTEFIAALGEPTATRGTGAESWGLWSDDPGPRGVLLRDYEAKLVGRDAAPAGWTFDPSEWWLEEYGRIMPGTSKLPPRRYVVTANRELTTVLTVDSDGSWELAKGTLADVTHLPCRAARYTPSAAGDASSCTPERADLTQFRVPPGAEMPPVPGCAKQDFRVLFVLGYSL